MVHSSIHGIKQDLDSFTVRGEFQIKTAFTTFIAIIGFLWLGALPFMLCQLKTLESSFLYRIAGPATTY